MLKFKIIVRVNMCSIHLSNHLGSLFFVIFNESLNLQ